MIKFNGSGGGVKNLCRDSGENVQIVPFFPALYFRDESTELSRKYDLTSHPGFVSSSLGSTGTETFAGFLFGLYRCVDNLVGVPVEDLETVAKASNGLHYIGRLESKKFLVREKIEGIEVLFPTEEFLKNQQVTPRDPI